MNILWYCGVFFFFFEVIITRKSRLKTFFLVYIWIEYWMDGFTSRENVKRQYTHKSSSFIIVIFVVPSFLHLKITNYGCYVELWVDKNRRLESELLMGTLLAQIVNKYYHKSSPYSNRHCAEHYNYIMSSNSHDWCYYSHFTD